MSSPSTNLLAGTWRYAPLIHWADNNHRHRRAIDVGPPEECYEILFAETGRAEIRAEQETRSLSLPAAVLRVPRVGPAVSVPAASSYFRIAFDVVRVPCRRGRGKGLIHRKREAQPLPEEVWGISLPPVVPPDLRESCHAMCSYCTRLWWRDDLAFMDANARLGQWLASLIIHLTRSGQDRPTSWAGRARSALKQSVDQPAGVADVARFLGMSRNRFTERFRRENGMTPREFLAEFRMDKACRLLNETDHGITKVADLCGWQSPTTFSGLFRRRFGVAPSEYRRCRRNF